MLVVLLAPGIIAVLVALAVLPRIFHEEVAAASAAELRQAGADEAIIQNMIESLQREMASEPKETTDGSADDSTPARSEESRRVRSHEAWQDITDSQSLPEFAEQDFDAEHGEWKPDEITMDHVQLHEIEGGTDMLFRQLPPKTRREMLFAAQVNIATLEKKIPTTSRKGDGSKAESSQRINLSFDESS